MPAVVALPAFWGAVAAGAAGTAGIVGAKMQSGAARDAASATTTAANHAADLKAKADADALAFTKDQAARDQANFETTQHANYDQWAARERRLGTLGGMIGVGPREIPPYVSSMPGGGSAPTADVGKASQMFMDAVQSANLDPVAVQGHGNVIADAVNKKFPGLGVTVDPKSDALIWPGIGPLDVTIDSGKGGWSFRPSGASAAASPSARPLYAPGTLGSYVPLSSAPLTPALTAARYAPGSLGYFGGQP